MNPDKRLTAMADDVMRCGQLAAALEACGWPKPGNAHRTSNLPGARFEHFVASSIAFGPALRDAFLSGARAGLGEINPGRMRVGALILNAVRDMRAWQKGGNTHLGTILIFVPLAAAAGYLSGLGKPITVEGLRRAFKSVARSTRPVDAVNVYMAIREAEPRGLGRVSGCNAPDVTLERAHVEILEKGLNLFDVMSAARKWDLVAREISSSLKVASEIGYPTFKRVYLETGDVNVATVHTYLEILSLHPDTHVARCYGARFAEDVREAVKKGMEKAVLVSRWAEVVLGAGGLLTREGRKLLFKMDLRLRREGLHPGAAADLTASSLYLALLTGLRP